MGTTDKSALSGIGLIVANSLFDKLLFFFGPPESACVVRTNRADLFTSQLICSTLMFEPVFL